MILPSQADIPRADPLSFLSFPRQSLHEKYFPYQLESCHAALDLFGNSGEQMDTEQFRCVADFTRCAKKRFLF